MSTVKRVAPGRGLCSPVDWFDKLDWFDQCLQDLAAGRHAVGCGCHMVVLTELRNRSTITSVEHPELRNACTEIVRCALEMRDYECEVGDASDKQSE